MAVPCHRSRYGSGLSITHRPPFRSLEARRPHREPSAARSSGFWHRPVAICPDDVGAVGAGAHVEVGAGTGTGGGAVATGVGVTSGVGTGVAGSALESCIHSFKMAHSLVH
jgi:hypothetical protein